MTGVALNSAGLKHESHMHAEAVKLCTAGAPVARVERSKFNSRALASRYPLSATFLTHHDACATQRVATTSAAPRAVRPCPSSCGRRGTRALVVSLDDALIRLRLLLLLCAAAVCVANAERETRYRASRMGGKGSPDTSERHAR